MGIGKEGWDQLEGKTVLAELEGWVYYEEKGERRR
jgi:hypothetical protein